MADKTYEETLAEQEVIVEGDDNLYIILCDHIYGGKSFKIVHKTTGLVVSEHYFKQEDN